MHVFFSSVFPRKPLGACVRAACEGRGSTLVCVPPLVVRVAPGKKEREKREKENESSYTFREERSNARESKALNL